MRKTKIVCTIGPASSSSKIIKELILAGMDVARLNFSHGEHREHLAVLERIRKISKELNKPVGVIQDLCGPKIRVGKIKGEKVKLEKGKLFYLTSKEVSGDKKQVHISYSGLEKDIKYGERILIDDGLIELKVEKVEEDALICRVIVGGILSSHKGVNFPESSLKVPALTEKDIKDLRFGVRHKVDFIAQSFVRAAEDVLQLKDIITKSKSRIPVIVKIEKREAVKNIKEIIRVADGVMVARGDLGVEAPMEDVPLIQKDIIKRCNEISKPVITATQMLDSMIRNPRPTRAEATDVANAVLDGTDAVMLSGETASGSYPVLAVKFMAGISENAEKILPYENVLLEKISTQNVVEAISLATCEIAEELKAKAILTFTSSGRTAKRISKYKPRAPVLAAVDNEEVFRELSLSWGVYPFIVPAIKNTDKMIEETIILAKKHKLIKDMDMIIITAGMPAGISGSTNMIKIHIAGHTFLRGYGAGKKVVISGKLCFASSLEEARKKVEPCDILVVPDLKGGYGVVIQKVKGVITTLSHAGSPDEEILKTHDIPAILGIPNAFEVLTNGRIATLDVPRGLVYES